MSEDSQGEITLTMEEAPEVKSCSGHALDAPALVQLAEFVWAPCHNLSYAVATEKAVLMCPPDVEPGSERRDFYKTALLQGKEEKLPDLLRDVVWLKPYLVPHGRYARPWSKDETAFYADFVFAPPAFIVHENSAFYDFIANSQALRGPLASLGEFYFDGYITSARGLFLKLYGYEVYQAKFNGMPQGFANNLVKVVFDAQLAAKHKKRADTRDAPRPVKKKVSETPVATPQPKPEPPKPEPPGPVLTIDDLCHAVNSLARAIPHCNLSASGSMYQSRVVTELGYALDFYSHVHSPKLLRESDVYRLLVQTFGRAVQRHEKKFAESKAFLAWLRDQIQSNSDWREWPLVDRNTRWEWSLEKKYSCEAFGGIYE